MMNETVFSILSVLILTSISLAFTTTTTPVTASTRILSSSTSLNQEKESSMKGTVFIATSVDGFVARPDGDISWLTPEEEDEGDQHQHYSEDEDSFKKHSDQDVDDDAHEDDDDMGFSALLNSIDCIIMGRKTFDKVKSFGEEFWAYKDTPIIVYSHDPLHVMGNLPTFLREKGTISSYQMAPRELFQYLHKEYGYKLAYVDGPTVVQQFLNAGLIDSIHITSIPILLRQGIRLFDDHEEGLLRDEIKLKLVESKAFANTGMVSTKYDLIYPDSF
ncbi:hypothetical protein CTEN210_00892 [Chaetoceros tenuissimus]|uniref:Bacterial bifunctional deaminase-reductase C-terminal domain-containing protein n=1 Tax=Chaetoceros tenuissimus TaxID=426638 RepID=A0AAD3GZD4_9STRA|nr:hypothetical protein CTEN210_00892 [Chaetoceros tenuissimus]